MHVKVFLSNRRNFIKSGVEGNNKWRAICCGICVFLLIFKKTFHILFILRRAF